MFKLFLLDSLGYSFYDLSVQGHLRYEGRGNRGLSLNTCTPNSSLPSAFQSPDTGTSVAVASGSVMRSSGLPSSAAVGIEVEMTLTRVAHTGVILPVGIPIADDGNVASAAERPALRRDSTSPAAVALQ